MEVLATSLLKASEGFSKPLYGWASIACYSVCFWALSFVLAKIPVGVAYAIWSGLGIVGITVVGWLVFKQLLGWQQLAFHRAHRHRRRRSQPYIARPLIIDTSGNQP